MKVNTNETKVAVYVRGIQRKNIVFKTFIKR
jgi:hypothetical protein